MDSIRFKSKNADIFCGKNSVVNIHSSAKTFTSIALGIAMRYYNMDLNDPVIKFFPECAKSAYLGTEKIRIIDLLHMQAGKKLQSLLQDSGNALWNNDWLAWFFESPLNYPPLEQSITIRVIVAMSSGDLLKGYRGKTLIYF